MFMQKRLFIILEIIAVKTLKWFHHSEKKAGNSR